jgi:thioredoxin reductase (NADPH)
VSDRVENVIIVGGGPAGYTAALYTSRADLDPLVIEGFAWGGLLQQTTDVENYPGYPDGVMGPQMMQDFRNQAERFGARLVSEDATSIELSKDGGLHKVVVGDQEHLARSVILAMGAEPKKLGVPGEDELAARGVSYCATCDAAFFRGKETIVVGGGDTAMEEALFLTRFGQTVTVVHRRDELRASKVMQERAFANPKISFIWDSEVVGIEGEAHVTGVRLRNLKTGEETLKPAGALFVAIGHLPRTELFRGVLELDDEGYIKVESPTTRTSVPAVYAAGDVVDHSYRQAITAAGTGCAAALDAERHLSELAHHQPVTV